MSPQFFVLIICLLNIITGRSGMSENELEDILSCDDDVLNGVYQYWIPPIKRLPPLSLVRIKADLQQYLGKCVEHAVKYSQLCWISPKIEVNLIVLQK